MKALAALSIGLMGFGCRSEPKPAPQETTETEIEEPAEPAERPQPEKPQAATPEPIAEVNELPWPKRLASINGTAVEVPRAKRTSSPQEQAILDGLRWLARHQNPDGSWGALALESRCVGDARCSDPTLRASDHYDEGLTGLALVCFLSAGFEPRSEANLVDAVSGRIYPIGETIRKGLEWLRGRQHPDGSFSQYRPFMYSEALSTMAMAEAFGITRDPHWGESAQKGVDFLQASQRLNPDGSGAWGWRYSSRTELVELRGPASEAAQAKELSDSDTSVTGMCMLALTRAHRHGLKVAKDTRAGAMEFCKFVTANDGLVGYLDAKSAGAIVTGPFDARFTYHPTTMSALAMCIRIGVESNPDDPFLSLAAKRIVQDLPDASEDHVSIDYYYWLWGTLALDGLDGPTGIKRTGRYWKPWEQALHRESPSLQDRTENACSHGGWLVSDRWGSYSGAGPIYNTAMNVLTLEICFR